MDINPTTLDVTVRAARGSVGVVTFVCQASGLAFDVRAPIQAREETKRLTGVVGDFDSLDYHYTWASQPAPVRAGGR